MTFTDWIINIALIGLVIVQLHERRLGLIQILLPVALLSWAGFTYIHAFPTSGNSLTVLIVATLFGAAIGVAVGLATHVRERDGSVVVRAGILAASLWVIGMGLRLAFELFATGGGAMTVGRFDAEHQISNDTWPAALILMAAGTVLLRLVLLLVRTRRASLALGSPSSSPVVAAL